MKSNSSNTESTEKLNQAITRLKEENRKLSAIISGSAQKDESFLKFHKIKIDGNNIWLDDFKLKYVLGCKLEQEPHASVLTVILEVNGPKGLERSEIPEFAINSVINEYRQ